MITGSRDTEDFDRSGYAFYLLESSGYSDREKAYKTIEIANGSPDEIEVIIKDLELNRVDRWNTWRLYEINKRLNDKGC